MTGKYAAGTDVPVDRSRAEIERTLRRYDADQFAYGWEATKAVIQFRMRGRVIRIVVGMPDRQARDFTTTSTGRARSSTAAEAAWEQACRQRWRALALVIKAKLEAVDVGIATFEDEFLAHTLLPDGETVGEFMRPQVDQAYRDGRMPDLLAIGPPR